MPPIDELDRLVGKAASRTMGAVTRIIASGIVFCVAIGGCGNSPEDRLSRARELQESGQVGDSIAILESLLDETPNHREANHLMGLALLAIDQPALAIWPLGKAAEAPEAGFEDQLLLGRAHLAGGSEIDALNVANSMLEQASDLIEARELRVQALISAERLEEALEDVEVLLDFQPDDQQSLVTRVSILLNLERVEEAEEAIATAREVFEKIESSRASPSAKRWASKLCAVGATFLFEKQDEGHVEQAKEAWESCLDEFPTQPIVVDSAVSFFDGLGEMDRSVEILREALEGSPKNADLRLALGFRLEAIGEHEEAAKMLQEAAESSSGPSIWFQLAEYHDHREEYPEARAAMEKALELARDPSPVVQMQFADLLIRAGDYDAAEKATEEIERPEYKSLLLGRIAFERGQPEKALTLLTEGLRLWPSNTIARELAGRAAEQLRDYDRALTEYTEAVRADPNNWEALESLATIRESMRHPGPLVQLVSRYANANPKDPRGYTLLAEIAIWSNQDSTAKHAIQQLSRLPGQIEIAARFSATHLAAKNPLQAVNFIRKSPLDLTRPESVEVLRVLVENLSIVDRPDLALARADEAIEVHPDFAPFHELRALALDNADKPEDEVLTSLERALELEPNRASTLLALGRLAAKHGRIDDSIAFFDRAAMSSVDQDDMDAKSSADWAAIETLVASRRDSEIDARLESLLASDGMHTAALQLAARRIVEGGGDLERAERLSRRAIRFNGGPEAVVTLGRTQLAQDKADEAVPTLRNALRMQPDSPTSHYWLGVALARSGDTDGARTELDAALSNSANDANDTFEFENEARAELARLDSKTKS